MTITIKGNLAQINSRFTLVPNDNDRTFTIYDHVRATRAKGFPDFSDIREAQLHCCSLNQLNDFFKMSDDRYQKTLEQYSDFIQTLAI